MDTAKALSKIKLSLKRLPIYKYRYFWFIVPATILFIALVCGAVYSGSNVYGNFANVGIDFEGGTVLTVNITGGGSYADNAKITNNSTNGAVRVTGVEVTDGAYKVGIALCSAASGGTVEVDPRGFGESAWQLYSCGVHTWKSATSVDKLDCSGLPADGVVIAAVQTAGGSEKTAKAAVTETGITFTLDANGTSGTTKIAWVAIRKN